ncbi:MAG: S9 family peptidase [Ignavibacteriae bacterium]|nr:MAG: S9 family peptidase [Ignavibacteriota bacterium]
MTKLLILFIQLLLLLYTQSYSQEVTLEYIFSDTAIVNARPSLKFISAKDNKIFYFADDDYDGSLSFFDYNYRTAELYKYSDTADTPSEFTLLSNGELLFIMQGDLYVSKNFTSTRSFSKDVRLTNTDSYEYSPEVRDDFVIYRRSGNYFMKLIDSAASELQLTNDESDTLSNQIIGVSGAYGDSLNPSIRLLFAKYDKSTRDELLFPNYTREFVTVDKQLRGQSKVKLLEYEINTTKGNSGKPVIKEQIIMFPDTSIRYSTQYTLYSPDVKNIIFDVDNPDRHSRKMFNYDITGRKMTEIYNESYEGWFERHSNATRFINDNEIIFESEVNGYNSLYKINKDGSGFSKVVGDNYTILESVVDRKNKKVYFTANIETPVKYNIYETDLNGSFINKLTNEEGDAVDMAISQDAQYIFYLYSYFTQPSEIYYYDIAGKTNLRITNTINPKFTSVNWNIPEIITFNNKEDGQLIYGFLYKPKDFNPKKKHPLICFAHGAGYLQNVTTGYSPYGDNFMVNTFLTSQGFLIFECDFRGSLGYGADFRSKTHKNLGYWELSDYMSGIDYLDNRGIIDREKVGIYGGSYGGFITLMSVFRHPEYFKAGVALRAVSNWRLYYYGNRWFTLGRLGDYNNENKNFYEQSSPITFAENLSVPLLITHGMLDDNVFFQDAVQLTQKLIDNKKDFEVMIYPKEYHSFHLQTSWLDQYKRIYKFFEKYLK